MHTIRAQGQQRLRPASQYLLPLGLLMLLSGITPTRAEDKKPDPVTEKAARDALVRFDKGWKDYTNEPNYGDPRWKLKMETLVALARAGASATPLLEAAAKENSSWAAHTRELAIDVLKVCRQHVTVRDAWASYDLSQIDIAREGKPAPDFALADAAGRIYRLSDVRGKKTIVLSFILQDT